jgi:fructosamine-3-kinase
MSALEAAVARTLSATLGRPVSIQRRTPLGGGSISDTARIDTTAGAFVLKSLVDAPAGLFRSEAAGLMALGASGATLTVPQVIVCHDAAPPFLVIEYLASGRRAGDFDERLGRGLAELHRTTSARYGFEMDNFCGATPQVNTWDDSWVAFYGRERLGRQIERARRAGLMSRADTVAVESLIGRLDRWLPEPAHGPSLVHGDLWSGNLHVDASGRPAIIDPAVYFADREADFGIMTLFGGFGARVFEAYDEVFPLDPEWRDRNGLYQLYHLLNHLNLFGQAYHGQVMRIVTRYV